MNSEAEEKDENASQNIRCPDRYLKRELSIEL
jgi:hypothetical protein